MSNYLLWVVLALSLLFLFLIVRWLWPSGKRREQILLFSKEKLTLLATYRRRFLKAFAKSPVGSLIRRTFFEHLSLFCALGIYLSLGLSFSQGNLTFLQVLILGLLHLQILGSLHLCLRNLKNLKESPAARLRLNYYACLVLLYLLFFILLSFFFSDYLSFLAAVDKRLRQN